MLLPPCCSLCGSDLGLPPALHQQPANVSHRWPHHQPRPQVRLLAGRFGTALCFLLLAACLAAWPVISLRLHSCLHQLFICTTPHSWPLPPGLPAYHCSGDYIRSDYEEKQAIATLQAIELVKYCMEVGACPLDFHGLSWPSAGWAFGRLCGWVLQAAWRGGGPG